MLICSLLCIEKKVQGEYTESQKDTTGRDNEREREREKGNPTRLVQAPLPSPPKPQLLHQFHASFLFLFLCFSNFFLMSLPQEVHELLVCCAEFAAPAKPVRWIHD